MLHAVVTGDIVGSSHFDLSERRQLPQQIRKIYRRSVGYLPTNDPYPIDLFGGDSWQFCIRDSVRVLALVTHFRAALFAMGGVRTRCAIAIDTVDFLEPGNISESDGPAFRRSGRLLKDLDETELQIVLPDDTLSTGKIGATALVRMTDLLYKQWTAAQAQSVMHRCVGFLGGTTPSQAQIAKRWQPESITQQAVARHLRSAEWGTIELTLADFETLAGYIVHDTTNVSTT